MGSLSFRVRKLIESEKFDVISTSWLRSLPVSEEPCSLSPLDMLSIKNQTKVMLSLDYDEFGDNYKVEIDEETLKKCLKKMENEVSLLICINVVVVLTSLSVVIKLCRVN